MFVTVCARLEIGKLIMQQHRISVIISRKQVEAQNISMFELVASNGDQLPPFSAGAHIEIYMPNGITRQYSLCNHPRERHRYLIAVLRDSSSRGGSSFMHDSVSEGDVNPISSPRNHFALADDARRSILIAGGIGITPILSMAEQLHDAGADFELHYAGRSLHRTAFVERIRAGSIGDRARFYFDDGAADQRFNAQSSVGKPADATHIYVCGPFGFIESVLGAARAAGWEDTNLHREYFGAVVPVKSSTSDTFEMEISSTGQILLVPPGKSALEVLSEHGVNISSSCEQGVCGTCLTRVISGEPDHRDVFLSEAERLSNSHFTPCCSRAKSGRLVLGL